MFTYLGILEVELYPYGNTIESNSTDGNYTHVCEHGPSECTANFIQACFIDSFGGDMNFSLPFVNCMESAEKPIQAAPDCWAKVSGFAKWKYGFWFLECSYVCLFAFKLFLKNANKHESLQLFFLY